MIPMEVIAHRLNLVDVKVKRLSDAATLPRYQTDGAACMDLHAAHDLSIPPGKALAVDTGLAFEIPQGWEMQIRSRSGHAFKAGVTSFPGTVDSDFRGSVRVLIINGGPDEFVIKTGDRIAQAAIGRAYRARLIEVDELGATARGEGGFGHTGK